jgi:predicted dehydrogenase/nucleoside-diphosphate-sugar epimerase
MTTQLLAEHESSDATFPQDARSSDSAQTPVRIAIVGCGAIAEQMHLPVLAGHERFELTALVDRDVDRARRFAQAYGVPHVFGDSEHLNSDLIDAAVLATPPSHHAPGSIELMRRGIHVLVEKPMAMNLREAEAMVGVAEECGVTLAVGFFRRFYPSARLLKSLLESGWLGKPLRFRVEGGGFYSSPAATLSHMVRDLAGGGVLIDFGSHLLDMLVYLFGEEADVLEYRENSLGGVEADCCCRLRFDNAGEPVEGLAEFARTRNLGAFVRVDCERGSLEFQMNERFRIRVTPNDLTLTDPATNRQGDFWLDAGWSAVDESQSWYEDFRKQFDDWLQAIDSGREPAISGRTALASVRLIDECYARPKPMDEPWVEVGGRRSEVGGRNGRKKRVLITGATGFIGCRAAEVFALHEGWDVRALVHNPGNASRLARLPVEMVQGDLSNGETVGRLVEGCDAVVHCAVGTVWGDRRANFAINVDGTRRLAEAALAAGVERFVHFSTISVYGDDSAKSGRVDESTPLRPTRGSDYGETKAAAEGVIRKAAAKGLNACIFRPARVFGPFSRIFIMNPLTAMAANGFHWLGSPDVRCDMVYVDNLVDAVLKAIAAPEDKMRGEAFNISDGDPQTWREFYQVLADELGLDLSSVPVDPPRFQGRPGLARRVFGWPLDCVRGMAQIGTSPEFKSLGRRVLQTDPIGTLPRWALQRFPGIERAVRRLIKADDSLPVYRRSEANGECLCQMGSGGALVSIEKARRQLGYEPHVSRNDALQQTLAWVRHARLVD